ncbi:MAG TPA: aspartate-semialdehyde dehydrogenase [Caldilineae bacterium]|jgi:aspartate-semialdehyde dehydrogenase|nr:aspartate-semialdehyde dehydrogenase [Caldilineae bacterium]
MGKIRVGILGATGAVGQRFVQLLEDHPWFELTVLAASDRSVGKRYAEACHWILPEEMPERVRDMVLQDCTPGLECELLFSALPSHIAREVEPTFAEAGYIICSNASAYRMEPDIPLLIPEVNPDHTGLIETQRQRRGWSGFIITNPNCTTTHLVSALKPLHEAFGLEKVFVVSMQAISGAGYPGVASLDILDNVIPYISGEEEKVESEPRKLLGRLAGDHIEMAPFQVSAQCNRVDVRDGHTECVSVALRHSASREDIVEALRSFRSVPQEKRLPHAPDPAIIVRDEPDRPQPVLDRLAGDVPGMATVVGRIRPCPLLDWKFVVLGHNTIRGAAGGALLNAELLVAQGWIAS